MRLRFPPSQILAAGSLLLLPAFLRAEIVEFRVTETLPIGKALHIGSELPEMGAGDPLRSVRMVRESGDTWMARFDIPSDVHFVPRLYIRDTAPESAADPAAVVFLRDLPSSGADTATEETLTIRFHLPEIAESATITAKLAPGGETLTVEADSIEELQGFRAFTMTLPRRTERFSLAYKPSGTDEEVVLFLEDPVRLTVSEYWAAADQLFRYTPPASPSPPRKEQFLFAPDGFHARNVTVFLPRGYDENAWKQYPVLYAMDGQNVFVPGGPFGTWAMDTTTEHLTARAEVPEFIIVAVDNSPARMAEYTPDFPNSRDIKGRGGQFLAMLRDELKPYIDDRYRTRSAASDTSFVGSSLGGLLGYLAANEMEDTFGNVAAVSPAFWLSLEAYLGLARRDPSERGRLWLDSGHLGAGADGFANTYTIRDAMLLSGAALGPDFTHTVGPNHSHNEPAWAQRLPEMLQWLLNPTPKPATDDTTVQEAK